MSIFKACFEKHIHLPRFSTHSFIMGCFDDISTIEIQCLVYGIRVRDIRHTTNPKHTPWWVHTHQKTKWTEYSVTDLKPEKLWTSGWKMKEVSRRFAEQSVSIDIPPLEAWLLHRTFTIWSQWSVLGTSGRAHHAGALSEDLPPSPQSVSILSWSRLRRCSV